MRVEHDGSLTIADKRTNRLYRGMNRFVDGGDCGDEYNYSPPETDCLAAPARLVKTSVKRGPVQQTLTVELKLELPPRLNRNRKSRVSRREFFVGMPITCRVSLAAGVPRVDVHTTLQNRAQDHRLRVHFPAPFRVDTAEHDGHFEIVRRKIGIPPFDRATWIEDPRPEVPQRAFTDISDGQTGLMLANRGLPEVEVLESGAGSEIALTLLRCVGWLSREDFQTRRWQAGPEEATPAAQMMGEWNFDYSIIPHGPGRPHEQAYAFETPLRAEPTGIHAGSLPGTGSFVALEAGGSQDFVISAVKWTEDGSGWIVRGYNTGSKALDVILTPWRRFASAARVNLAEQETAGLAVEKESGAVKLQVAGHEIVTVKFTESRE